MSKRIDYFLIWPHAEKDKEKILKKIFSFPKKNIDVFEISDWLIRSKDLKKFSFLLYESEKHQEIIKKIEFISNYLKKLNCDYFSISVIKFYTNFKNIKKSKKVEKQSKIDIKAKIKYYFLKLKKENPLKICLDIINLIQNKLYDFKKFIFKTSQSSEYKKYKEIEDIKINIRNQFNPKLSNKNKTIYPLRKGVSHNHVIHSSDYELDIVKLEFILEKFGILKNLERYKHKN